MPDLTVELNEALERASDQRGLRMNLIALALDQPTIFPVPEWYAQLWAQLREALEPIDARERG